MSDSPIFHQLVSEFAAKGAVYEEFVRFTTPAFEWEPDRPVVQLDKPNRGICITKHVRGGSHCSCGIVWPCTIGAEKEEVQLMQDYVKPNAKDNTFSLVVDGLHPTVKPLSERNTAQLME